MPKVKMPPIRKLRDRPRSEVSCTTCPTRSPRSRAKTLPIKMLQYIEEAPDPTLAALSTLILLATVILLVLSDRLVGLHRMAGTAE